MARQGPVRHGKVTVAVGVVAHPQRQQMAEQLAAQVAADSISWDDGRYGNDYVAACAANHMALLNQLAQKGATWVVCLEDDAQPVPAFRTHLQQALEFAPAPIIGAYLGTGNPSGEVQRQIRQAVVTAQDSGLAWIVGDALVGSVGYAIEAVLVEDMLGFIVGRDEELPLRISRWVQARGLEVGYTTPSLVDHADIDPVDATMLAPASQRRGRKAWSYGIREQWDTATVRLGYCPRWSADE